MDSYEVRVFGIFLISLGYLIVNVCVHRQWSTDSHMPLASRLNPRQKEAMIAITEKCITPPILVIG